MFDLWTIAAFSQIISSGNLAGVAIVEEFSKDEIALSIAKELNHSETAFVKVLGKNEFAIRWFTPKYEVDLCGHATLAAAFLLWDQGMATEDRIRFISKSGVLEVFRRGELITLDFAFEYTSPIPSDFCFDWEKALGGFKPIHIAQAFGVFKEYLVELESADDIQAMKPNIDEINKLPGNGLIVTAKGNGKFLQYDFVSRVFAPQDGIPEDPVCASAHCKLAHYWEQRLNKQTFKAYQPSSRGGEIWIERKENRVFLSGHAVKVKRENFSVR